MRIKLRISRASVICKAIALLAITVQIAKNLLIRMDYHHNIVKIGDDVVVVSELTTSPILVVSDDTNTTTKTMMIQQSADNKEELTTTSCFNPRPIDMKKIPKDLPKPIIHLGMPKTGTTSLESFFKCGKFHTSHSICRVTNDGLKRHFKMPTTSNNNPGLDANGECHSNRARPPCQSCSKCMYYAKNYSLPILESCGNYDVFAQMDTVISNCHYPQLKSLDSIHNEAPTSTFIYMFRNINGWINSITHYRDGQTKRALNKCSKKHRIPFLNNGTEPDNLKDFFCGSVTHARKFVAAHPSHTLIEVDLDDPNTGSILSTLFGIEESCWGAKNVNPELHQQQNDTTVVSLKNSPIS